MEKRGQQQERLPSRHALCNACGRAAGDRIATKGGITPWKWGMSDNQSEERPAERHHQNQELTKSIDRSVSIAVSTTHSTCTSYGASVAKSRKGAGIAQVGNQCRESTRWDRQPRLDRKRKSHFHPQPEDCTSPRVISSHHVKSSVATIPDSRDATIANMQQHNPTRLLSTDCSECVKGQLCGSVSAVPSLAAHASPYKFTSLQCS